MSGIKIEYKELEKAIEYMRKHSDKCKVTLGLVQVGQAFECLTITFTDGAGDSVVLTIPTDERQFSKLTRTERF